MSTPEAFFAEGGFIPVHTLTEAERVCDALSFPRQVGVQVSGSDIVIGVKPATKEAALEKIRDLWNEDPDRAIGISDHRNGQERL